jgi:hypothetical protein
MSASQRRRKALAAAERERHGLVKPDHLERRAIKRAFGAFQALVRMGWRDAEFAPRDVSDLHLIEIGSTGIHRGFRSEDGRFWIVDSGETLESSPILFRLAPKEEP